MITLTVRTTKPVETQDVTSQVQEAVTSAGVREGTCVLHVPHTTAGVLVNEHDDPDVMRDLLHHLATLIPQSPAFRHAEGNADAHIKSSIVGCTTSLIVSGGRLVLGRWQGVFFCEFDGPRARTLHVQVIGS